ncbi:hypothetical protein ACEPAF_1566 [Sanghuangporus sanghuang]
MELVSFAPTRRSNIVPRDPDIPGHCLEHTIERFESLASSEAGSIEKAETNSTIATSPSRKNLKQFAPVNFQRRYLRWVYVFIKRPQAVEKKQTEIEYGLRVMDGTMSERLH